jgi:glutaredoxin
VFKSHWRESPQRRSNFLNIGYEVRKMKRLLFALLLLSSVFAIQVIDYYGATCPHCADTKALLEELGQEYEIELIEKEVSSNAGNRAELFEAYKEFGVDPNEGGVPTLVVEGKAMIIGTLTEEQWRNILDDCVSNDCPEGVFTSETIDSGKPLVNPIEETDEYQALTLWGLVAAAVVDSLNPCTIAVMVMLLGLILISEGRKKMLLAAITFIFVIFVCYILLGLGILQVMGDPGLTNIFFSAATVGLLVLSIMEINAYLSYHPGFFAVEMPMFLRPHAKKAIEGATSLPGVAVAALFCSLFLLPCSSGPYLVVLAIISKAVTLNAIFYLLLYNVIFVLPMVIIAGAVYFGYTTVEKVGEAKEKYIKQIHLLSGIILFLLFLYMASTYLFS